ncbi:MAG: NUDIX domain-containing protein [Chloroflexi bacterium]|nr:NUDIX domain-containing protein [Chloroflexota bacterium]
MSWAERGITVAVGAVIEDRQGGVLLVKHVPQRGGFWQGKWICPGGRLEWGESIEDGIRREVREETNLEVALTHPLVPFERIESGLELHVIYIDYLARLESGELRVGDDVGEAIWVNKRDLWKRWDEMHQDTRRLLQIAGLLEEGANVDLGAIRS